MATRRGIGALLVLAAVSALPFPAASVSAEPTEPDIEWVKTSDDSVVGVDTWRGLGEGGEYFQSVVVGAGFAANDYRNLGAYTVRLVTSAEGDIENYRAELQQTANEILAAGGAVLEIAPGTITGPANSSALFPPNGEIWVMISSSSGCGTLSGGTLGCGGPSATFANGEPRWTRGVVWLSPTMATKCHQAVTTHEVSHALGLAHFDEKYLGVHQVMKSSTNCIAPIALQAGDLNGHRWLIEGAPSRPSNDMVDAFDEVCPLRDTTMSAVTFFASAQAGEPAHAGIAANHSVWYRYESRPDQAGLTATITTSNDGVSDFDTVLAVYTGTMFAAVAPVASNDDFSGDLSRVQFTVQANQTYWIAVDGYASSQGETDVAFDLPATAQPTPPAVGVPTRLMDTRRPGGQTFDCYDQAVGRIAAGATYQLSVINRAYVPANATSVILNVTAVQPSAGGFVTVFPCGTTQPNASNLNFAAGDVIPNLVIAKVGTGGKVCFYTSQAIDLIVDVSGFFRASDALVPLSPGRLLDTRAGGQTVDAQHAGVGRLVANVPYELPVTGRALVDPGATAVVLNVTAVQPDGGGFVTVYPCGQPPPDASNLNFAPGDVIPNAVLAGVGTAGKVCFVSSVATDLLVDVSGYLKSTPVSWFSLSAPARMLDTRLGGHTFDALHQSVGPIQAGTTYELPIAGRGGVAAGAVSVVLNVTAVGPSSGGYVTVFPCGSTQPNASNLNFAANDVIPNAVIARVGSGGKVCFYSSTQTDLLVDVSGYFTT